MHLTCELLIKFISALFLVVSESEVLVQALAWRVLHLHRRRAGQLLKLLERIRADDVQRAVLDVEILHVILRHFEPVARAEPLKVLIPRQDGVDVVLNAQRTRSLVCPRPSDILDGVSAAAEQDEWYVLLAQELHARSVPVHREIEAAELVAG